MRILTKHFEEIMPSKRINHSTNLYTVTRSEYELLSEYNETTFSMLDIGMIFMLNGTLNQVHSFLMSTTGEECIQYFNADHLSISTSDLMRRNLP